MSAYHIVLASASPRRRELLKQIGLSFTVMPSRKEEKVTSVCPEQVVRKLSWQKAEDIFSQITANEIQAGSSFGREKALVIGTDTVVCCDGMILGKPKDRQDAVRMLERLQGRCHQVYTGVTLLWGNGSESFFECTEVEFYPMSGREIEEYTETSEPLDKAGAYGIQGRCAAYIKGIRGDYNNVVGLPVGRLYQEMHKRELL